MSLRWLTKQWNRAKRFVSLNTGSCIAPPSLLIIHPTYRCNLKCYMCFTQPEIEREIQEGMNGGELSIPEWMDVIKQGFSFGVERIWIAGGGEPLLKEGVLDLMAYVKRLGLRGMLITNGVLAGEGFRKTVVDSGWEQVVFSIDAADKKTYERIRGRDFYERICKNLKALTDLRCERGLKKLRVSIYTVVLPENIKSLREIIGFAGESGVDKVTFGNAFPESRDAVLDMTYKEEKSFYRDALDFAEKIGVKTNLDIFLRKRETLSRLSCTKPWTQMGVRYDGRVEPCALSKEIVGDVRENSLREIWGSMEYRDLRRKRYVGEFEDYCDNCDILDQEMFLFSKSFYRYPGRLLEFLKKDSQF